MKHLYIIGNGFDIYSGLHTRYSDFRRWLQTNYPFVYENMEAAYEMDGEWWNNFEEQLGNLNINRYVRKFLPPEKPIEQIIQEIEERRTKHPNYSLPPNLYHDSPCANRLRGLLDILQYCFERWVDHVQRQIVNPQYVDIETEDAYFINFNYTDTIQRLYKVPDEQILHIHGRATKHDHLIFGHNKPMLGATRHDFDGEKVGEALSHYNKNPYVCILKHDTLPIIIQDTQFVHIYGLSFSNIDEPYIDWVAMNTDANKWEISNYSEEDKNQIEKFILNHWILRDRIKLIKLENIKKTKQSPPQTSLPKVTMVTPHNNEITKRDIVGFLK